MDVEQLEQRDLRRKKLLVAALFSLALVFALIFAYWMGAFGIGPTKHLYLNYDFAGGLDRGSPVRLAGIKVGRVRDVAFQGQPAVLRLEIDISNEAFRQITDDSKFFINLAGLIGERYVEVVPGQGARIENGHSFRGIDPPRIDQLISQGYGIFGDLRALFNENKGDLKEILSQVNDLTKNLNKLLAGTTGEQKKQLTTLLRNFAEMSTDLKGFVGSLNNGVSYMQANGGRQSWDNLRTLLDKGNKIGIQDLRKLMLEDGVKVNFSSRKVETAQ